jgi:pimeloyl-ACP methyl ester carboxylesterase
MPETLVRGVAIHYEVFGDRGPWIALTPGSRRGHEELVPMAQALAGNGCRVLLHDRRNCGSSDVSVEPLGSEYEIWADDLHALSQQLDALPMYVGGCSSGARLSILFGLRHPDALKGLLLWRVTGGRHASEKLAEQYYGRFIRVAAAGGMQAVAETDHFQACIAAKPSNREKLLAMDVRTFTEIMEMWREHFIRAANMPIIGATEEELQGIKVPVCLIAGNDRVHSPDTARKIARLLPNCEFHEDLVPQYPEDSLLQEWDRKEWAKAEPQMIEIFSSFLARQGSEAEAAAP